MGEQASIITRSPLTDHGEDAAQGPDHEAHVDAASGGQDPGGRHEDPGADDAAHDDPAPVQKTHLRLELHPVTLLLLRLLLGPGHGHDLLGLLPLGAHVTDHRDGNVCLRIMI